MWTYAVEMWYKTLFDLIKFTMRLFEYKYFRIYSYQKL